MGKMRIRRDPPAKLSSRLLGSKSGSGSSKSQKLHLTGTSSTSKSEAEDDPGSSVPSPSNLTILEDLQQSDPPTTKSTKRKSSSKHARPSPANKALSKPQREQQEQQPQQPQSLEDIEKGPDDCTAGFILDAIVDTTNHNRGAIESHDKVLEEREPLGDRQKILHRLEQARILKDLATTEVLIKKEKKEDTPALRKPWVFVSIIVLAIGALGVVTAAIWMSIV